MAREHHIVGFRVGRENFGVPISLVHEIVCVPEITAAACHRDRAAATKRPAAPSSTKSPSPTDTARS